MRAVDEDLGLHNGHQAELLVRHRVGLRVRVSVGVRLKVRVRVRVRVRVKGPGLWVGPGRTCLADARVAGEVLRRHLDGEVGRAAGLDVNL